jgi:hypothetical protein
MMNFETKFIQMAKHTDHEKPLIDAKQEYLVVCDNKSCGYKIKSETGDIHEPLQMYVNMPCPLCGENLLTEKDYLDAIRMVAFVDLVNKWCGWMRIFGKSKKGKILDVKVHNGIKVQKRK